MDYQRKKEKRDEKIAQIKSTGHVKIVGIDVRERRMDKNRALINETKKRTINL